MGRFSIKFKLVLLFVLIKLLPLFLISYVSYLGILKLGEYFDDTTRYISNSSKEIIFNTANEAIEDSVKNLDKKAQESLERLTFEVANSVADFLYQRDEDINLLSNFDINQDILQNFYDSKNRNIIVHNKFIYNDKTNLWEPETEIPIQGNKNTQANLLVDNNNEFNVINPIV